MEKVKAIRHGEITDVYLASDVDARILVLERALHQIKNGCVDDDDKANELFRCSPREIREIAVNALAGFCL